MLVDLYDMAGARLGTTETVPLVGVMVVGDTTMVGVAADTSVVRIDAATATAEVADDLEQRLRTLLGESAPDPVARTAQVVLAHQRLAVVGAGWVSFVDADAAVVAVSPVDNQSTAVDAASTTQRCVVVFGSPSEQATVFDASDGATIATFEPSVPIGTSLDGCTVARQGFGTATGAWRGYRIVGPDLDLSPTQRVVAVAPDGAAALVSGATTALLRFDGSTPVPLVDTTALGAFARLAA